MKKMIVACLLFCAFSLAAETRIACQQIVTNENQEIIYLDSWLVMIYEESSSETIVQLQYFDRHSSGNYYLSNAELATSPQLVNPQGLLLDPLSSLSIPENGNLPARRIIMTDRQTGVFDNEGNEFAAMLINIFTDVPLSSYECLQII